MPDSQAPAQARVVTRDLWFPEGPATLPDGSCLLVEIRRGSLTRVSPDGRQTVLAELGGGPNGAALGPDGQVYVCNNGGFAWASRPGLADPMPVGVPADYTRGSIQRVDLASGRHEVLIDQVAGRPLRGPNDLVFDAHGGFWFSDLGKGRERDLDRGGLYYVRADGSVAREVVFPLMTPNGVGLSPDGQTVYVAETATARLWAWSLSGPGEVRGAPRLLYAATKAVRFDSLAVEAGGNICVATLGAPGHHGGITVISPQGGLVEEVTLDDPMVTNICFGGPDLRTAFITVCGQGRLLSMPWPRAGLKLNH